MTIGVRVFGIFAGLITSSITARSLGPANRGAFFYVVATSSVLAQFGHLGAPGSNTFFSAPQPSLARRLLRWNIVLAALSSMLLAGGFLLLTQFPDLRASAPTQGGRWLAPMTFAVLLMAMLGPLLAGLHAFRALNGIQLAYQAGLLLMFGATAWIAPRTDSFLAASTIAALLATAAYVWACLRLAPPDDGAAALDVKAWLRYGARAYLILVLGALMPRLGLFFVKSQASSAQLGYYSIAVQAFDALALLPASIATILFPTILRSGDRSWAGCRRELVRMLGFAILIATCAALGMPLAVRTLFGEAFAPVTPIAIAFLPGFIGISAASISSQYLAALGYPPVVTINWLVAVVVLAACSAFLVPYLGGLGAAAAASGAYCLLAVLMLLAARRLLLAKARP